MSRLIRADGDPNTDPSAAVEYSPIMGSSSHAQRSTGLCVWVSDFRTCCLTYCCPCINCGQNEEIIDDREMPSCGIGGTLYGLMTIVSGMGGQWMYPCACLQ
ncbi:hypothetical protein vseg_002758 [Gypsophila vaccaria]